MNIYHQFQHGRLQKWLPLYLDEALPVEKVAAIAEHVRNCVRCQARLAEIRYCRDAISRARAEDGSTSNEHITPLRVIHGSTFQERAASSERTSSVMRPLLLVAAVLAVFLLSRYGLLPYVNHTNPASGISAANSQQAGIDFGFLFNLMDQAASTDPFYEQFDSKLITAAALDSCAPCPILPGQSATRLISIDCIKELRNRVGVCTELSCNTAGKAFKIFQQPAGQPWILGDNPIAREEIDGIECLIIQKEQYCVVIWKEAGREFLLVGDLNRVEVVQIIRSMG